MKQAILAFVLVSILTMTHAPAKAEKAELLITDDPKIDYAVLDKLVKAAEKANSDAVVVMHDGRLIGEWHFEKEDRPIDLMSVTKSIVSIAIGKLITDEKLSSLDEPVWKIFPEWKQGQKEKILIRHLMNHTSGLQANAITTEIYESPDFVKLALAAELTSAPGTTFAYNNKAVNLLPAIVKKLTGKTIYQYMKETIFTPLGIKQGYWGTDGAGNEIGMAELFFRAADLAKLGQLMLNGGSWNGKQILSKDFVEEATKPAQEFNPSCGLLWWLASKWRKISINDETLADWKEHGFSADSIAKLAPLKNRALTYDEIESEIKTLAGTDDLDKFLNIVSPFEKSKFTFGPISSFEARGYLGQYLLVIPSSKLVIARLIASKHHKSDTDDFANFAELAYKICPEQSQ